MGNGIMTEFSSSWTARTKRALLGAAIAAAGALMPSWAHAESSFLPDPSALSLTPSSSNASTSASDADVAATTPQAPQFLDAAAPPPEQPNIHGFASVTFTTAYLTPRGLLVFDKGVVIQPIVGLVLPIGDFGPLKNYTWVAGIWNDIQCSQGDPEVGGWGEMDFFFSQSATVANVISLNLTYGEWNFPASTTNKPKAEQNLDLKISYDDSAMFNKNFSINPYVDLWWAMAGSSTVVMGRMGGTGYVEIGIVPTYTLKAVPDYPLTITLPTYFSTGPRSFWGRGGYVGGLSASSSENFGVARTALGLSVPASFIPARYGHWHIDAGVSYDYLISGALLNAGTLLTGNTNRSLVEGSVGFGVNF